MIQHSDAYRRRRFLNWFPLGLTYASLYMGRYNYNVVKSTVGEDYGLDKVDVATPLAWGFWVYAFSVLVNAPLADKLGGKKSIVVGAVGAAVANLVIGLLLLNGWPGDIVVGLTVLYCVNSYFQSFGALSVVKVNAAWFHVRERGVFGGIFGSMISLGYFLAISVGEKVLGTWGYPAVFLVPAAVELTMAGVVWLLVRDRPSEAGHEDFLTGDASSGDETPVTMAYIMKMIVTNPVLLTIAAAEFCTGFVRQGILVNYKELLVEVHGAVNGDAVLQSVGTAITIGGIVGALLAGFMSDKLFGSRRPPVAVIFYLMQVIALLAVGFAPGPWAEVVAIGFAVTWIFGVHGMLTGTASMDFGGRKAAATAAGMLDGIQYIAAGIAAAGSASVLQAYGWDGAGAHNEDPANAMVLAAAIIPFSLAGAAIMSRLWNVMPKGKGSVGH